MIKISYILWATVLLVIGCKKPNSKSFIGTYNCKFKTTYPNKSEKDIELTITQKNDSLILSFQSEVCSYNSIALKNERIAGSLNLAKDTLHLNIAGRNEPIYPCNASAGYNYRQGNGIVFFYKNKLEGRILYTLGNGTAHRETILKIQEL